MKVNYRGFEIDVHRENSMAGDPHLYFYVHRKSDGFEVICGFTEGEDTIADYVRYMRDRVDGFIDDPGEEVLPDHTGTETYTKLLANHRIENEKTERLHG